MAKVLLTYIFCHQGHALCGIALLQECREIQAVSLCRVQQVLTEGCLRVCLHELHGARQVVRTDQVAQDTQDGLRRLL